MDEFKHSQPLFGAFQICKDCLRRRINDSLQFALDRSKRSPAYVRNCLWKDQFLYVCATRSALFKDSTFMLLSLHILFSSSDIDPVLKPSDLRDWLNWFICLSGDEIDEILLRLLRHKKALPSLLPLIIESFQNLKPFTDVNNIQKVFITEEERPEYFHQVLNIFLDFAEDKFLKTFQLLFNISKYSKNYLFKVIEKTFVFTLMFLHRLNESDCPGCLLSAFTIENSQPFLREDEIFEPRDTALALSNHLNLSIDFMTKSFSFYNELLTKNIIFPRYIQEVMAVFSQVYNLEIQAIENSASGKNDVVEVVTESCVKIESDTADLSQDQLPIGADDGTKRTHLLDGSVAGKKPLLHDKACQTSSRTVTIKLKPQNSKTVLEPSELKNAEDPSIYSPGSKTVTLKETTEIKGVRSSRSASPVVRSRGQCQSSSQAKEKPRKQNVQESPPSPHSSKLKTKPVKQFVKPINKVESESVIPIPNESISTSKISQSVEKSAPEESDGSIFFLTECGQLIPILKKKPSTLQASEDEVNLTSFDAADLSPQVLYEETVETVYNDEDSPEMSFTTSNRDFKKMLMEDDGSGFQEIADEPVQSMTLKRHYQSGALRPGKKPKTLISEGTRVQRHNYGSYVSRGKISHKAKEQMEIYRCMKSAVEKGEIHALSHYLTVTGGGIHYGGQNSPDTLLHAAAAVGRVEVARLLLDHSAPLEAGDSYGCTPLMIAAKHGKTHMIQFLLESGADIEAESIFKTTALQLAISRENLEAVRLLLENGAQVNRTDSDHWTALSYANNRKNKEIVNLLRAYQGI